MKIVKNKQIYRITYQAYYFELRLFSIAFYYAVNYFLNGINCGFFIGFPLFWLALLFFIGDILITF
jgi:hypothetical protein